MPVNNNKDYYMGAKIHFLNVTKVVFSDLKLECKTNVSINNDRNKGNNKKKSK